MTEIYSKHPNGGGRVGRYATVSKDVHIDKDSIISGHCEIYGQGEIVNSNLDGWCRLHSSDVYSSRLTGFVVSVDTPIYNSYLDGDVFAANASISSCDLRVPKGQQIRVVESAELLGVTAYGPIFVSGANVGECEILPLVRILGGSWSRSPRIKRSPFQFDCIESHIEGNLLIGCWDRPVAQWKQMVAIYRRLGDRLAGVDEAVKWSDGETLGGFEKLSAEELSWYADAISGWEL